MIKQYRLRARAVARLAATLTFCAASHSSAEPAASNKALAEALFDEGRRLMDAHDYAHACPKLARSQELDEGIGTLLYLADCYEKSGHNASAWASFREAASRANARGETERERIATRRASVLEPLLAKLTIVVESSADLPGLSVTRDAERVARELWGLQSPLDPGVHSLDATAPGKLPWHGSVTLSDSEVRIVKIPALLDAPVTSAPPAPTAAGAGIALPSDAPPRVDARGADMPPERTVAYVLGALGVVGLGVGTGYGLAALRKNDTADAHCARPGNLCDPAGVAAGKDVSHWATTSNVAFGVGAAFSLGALALLFMTPKQHSDAGSWHLNAVAGKQGGQIAFAGSLP